ncbi:MAG: TIGR00341 family protein [Pseudomonadales bacterium]|nr:TIGR00341 family protein [Pseudomonadales bacterium]
MRLVQVIAAAGHLDTLHGIAEQQKITDHWTGAACDDGRHVYNMLVADDRRQGVMNALQSVLGGSDAARIVVLPVDTVLPRPEENDESTQRRVTLATREEIYSRVEAGARLDSNYLLLIVLSTIVAAVGLIENNVAVVVGAMVIAPLLGPNIALAFGSSLGDRGLTWQALFTSLVGLGLAFGLSLGIGVLWPVDLTSGEILARTDVGLDGVALALASGAAAVLSLTTGLSSTLVGVMVAVALLPPTATIGLTLGAGHPALAAGAALLLAVNVVCVILAAKVVFLARGVRARTWYERRRTAQSRLLSIVIWTLLFLVLVLVVAIRRGLLA